MVYSNRAAVKSGKKSQCGSQAHVPWAHSVLFILWRASSASALVENRTNPKPRLRFVSRSLTTTWRASAMVPRDGHLLRYRLFHLAELLETLIQCFVGSVPRQATGAITSVHRGRICHGTGDVPDEEFRHVAPTGCGPGQPPYCYCRQCLEALEIGLRWRLKTLDNSQVKPQISKKHNRQTWVAITI
jgi:hypothetical protein